MLRVAVPYSRAGWPKVERSARLAEAFAVWDTAGDGTICGSKLDDVLRDVGRTVPFVYQILGVIGQRVSFDEFLEIASAADTYKDPCDTWQDLLVTFSVFDDGNGYISLSDLIPAVDEHLKANNRNFVDDQLLGIYRKVFDVAVFDNPRANMTSEAKWEIFTQEFATFRKQQSRQISNAVSVCYPAAYALTSYASPIQGEAAGLCGQQSTDLDSSMTVIVADLGGKNLMSHTLASTCLVEEIKDHIQNVVGVAVPRQLLLLEGQVLSHEDATLFEAGVRDGASLTLVVKEDIKVDYAHFAGELMNFF